VSEVGWSSQVDPSVIRGREEFQAYSLQAGLETIYKDPLVGLLFWFCTQDFSVAAGDRFYGLYRPGDPTGIARKPAFDAFKAFCARREEEAPPQYTNQQVINAFYYAAVDLGLARRWSLMSKAGLSLTALAADRQGIYTGPPIGQLPNLTDAEKAAIRARLDEQVSRAAVARVAGEADMARWGTGNEEWDADLHLDLIVGVQEQTLEEVRRNNDLLALVLEQVSRSRRTGTGLDEFLSRGRE
jgi:hypothetical protein